MGIKTGGIVVVTLLLAGCSTLAQGGKLQQNPVVVGTVAIAAKSQCQQFAKDQPEAAATTADYLATLSAASAACVEGINLGLVP